MAYTIRKGAYGSGTTGFTAAVPTGGDAPVTGDVLLIVMESNDAATTAGTPATPSGWSKLFELTQSTGNYTTLTVFGKIAGASETDVSITGVGDHCSGSMTVISGHGATVIGDLVIGVGSNGANASWTTPGITVTAGSLIIACGSTTRDAASTTSWSAWAATDPASLTEIEDNSVATSGGGGIGVAYGTCAGTSTGTLTATVFNAAWVGVVIGVPPAGAVVTGAAAVAGAGAISATAIRVKVGAAAVAGAGAWSATGAHIGVGAAAVAGAGAWAASGVAVRLGTAAVAGAGAWQGAGTRVTIGAAAVAGAGAWSATGIRAALGAAGISGAGAWSATGVAVRLGVAAVTGQGAWSATGRVVLVHTAVAIWVSTGGFVATGYVFRAIIPETRIVASWGENRSLKGAFMPGKSWSR